MWNNTKIRIMDFINQHYRISPNITLSDKKQDMLIEYYKKRENWIDTNDPTQEYKNMISFISFLHCQMFGGTCQDTFEYTTKSMLTQSPNSTITIDNDYELFDDILDCVNYYKEGFDDRDNEVTIEQTELQEKIINYVVKLNANPNFQYIYHNRT